MSVIDELDRMWRLWAEATAAIGPADWAAATRCDGWSVKELTAHVADGVNGLAALVSREESHTAPRMTSAAAIVRVLKPDDESAARLALVADQRAREQAGRPTDELVSVFADDAPPAIESVRPHSALVVDYFRYGITTIAAAAGVACRGGSDPPAGPPGCSAGLPDVPTSALRRTAGFLVDLPPLVDFIEAASGRRPVDGLFPLHA